VCTDYAYLAAEVRGEPYYIGRIMAITAEPPEADPTAPAPDSVPVPVPAPAPVADSAAMAVDTEVRVHYHFRRSAVVPRPVCARGCVVPMCA
jgi:hypothetical protein